MKNLDLYLAQVPFDDTKQTVEKVTNEIFQKHLLHFDYKSRQTGLLLGEVQSGKTGQMFGIIAAAVDRGFDFFLILSTDNIRLQEQTLNRAVKSFADFCICGESDFPKYTTNGMQRPIILIIKKNVHVIKTWRNVIVNSKYLDGRTLFILDDEADAASLNTKVNRKSVSSINTNLEDFKKSASSCIYLQVTATPQAVLLQTIKSNFKPSFVTYFKPGRNYLGGDFFFSKPSSYTIRLTDEEETRTIKDSNEEIGNGLAQAVMCFLITVAEFKIKSISTVCNFLIHPSVRKTDHSTIALKIGGFLNDILQFYDDVELQANFLQEWNELQKSKPDITAFAPLSACIRDLLFTSEINVAILNSDSESEQSFDKGFNIIVGGNTLGRGVTFPMLQTIYYSRSAKKPQADTFWQHCRMFGYDRDRSLIRMFIPPTLHKTFQELNNSQVALVNQIINNGLDSTHLLYIDGVRPTRKCVVDSESLSIISGGVNYFCSRPINTDINQLDKFLLKYENINHGECCVQEVIEILNLIESEDIDDWNSGKYINAIRVIAKSQEITSVKIIVSTGHKLSKNTGTMLTQLDRNKIDSFVTDISLAFYKITGDKNLGWNGVPLWMPNIKFPEGFTLYKMEN